MTENRFDEEQLNRWRSAQIKARRERCIAEIRAARECLKRAFLEVTEEDPSIGNMIGELMDRVGYWQGRIHELLWPRHVETPEPKE